MVLLHIPAGRGARPKLLSQLLVWLWYLFCHRRTQEALDSGHLLSLRTAWPWSDRHHYASSFVLCECSHPRPIHIDCRHRRKTWAVDRPLRIHRRSTVSSSQDRARLRRFFRAATLIDHISAGLEAWTFPSEDVILVTIYVAARGRRNVGNPEPRANHRPPQQQQLGIPLCLYPVSRPSALRTLDLRQKDRREHSSCPATCSGCNSSFFFLSYAIRGTLHRRRDVSSFSAAVGGAAMSAVFRCSSRAAYRWKTDSCRVVSIPP